MKENFTKKDMKSFADWCRNGLLNTEYSVDKLDQHLRKWNELQEKKQGRIIEDGHGGR